MCNWLLGIVDMLSVMLIMLPLYSKPVDGYIYSVNLFEYTDISSMNKLIYWVVFLVFIMLGAVKMALTKYRIEKGQNFVTGISVGLSILIVLFLGMAREPYAVVVAFMLLVLKGMLLCLKFY